MSVSSLHARREVGAAPSLAVMPVALLLLVGLTSFLVSCHFNEAQDQCSELAKKLYEARETGQPDRVRAALTSSLLPEDDRDRLVRTIIDRDGICGHQESRDEYHRVTKREGQITRGYSARNRFRIVYATGETWEEVLCRLDDSGTKGGIIGMSFGPVPSR